VTDATWWGEARYRASLAVAEAANAHFHLSRVLDAVTEAREDLVPDDMIGITTWNGEIVKTGRCAARPADQEGSVTQDLFRPPIPRGISVVLRRAAQP